MHLNQLTGGVEHIATIGGKEYQFSELPIEALGRLQVWIKKHTPHPLESLKGHLDGLPAHVQESLAERARVEARDWPPKIGTAKGAIALMADEPGQIEALHEGLLVHYPDITRCESERIYRLLLKETNRDERRARKAGLKFDGEGAITQIFAVLFGTAELADEDTLPKA